MSNYVPPGYAGMVPITITNPSATQSLGGSTTTPVAAASTDYVVTCQLTGSAASTVFNGASDQSGFTDVSVWWTNPSGTQIQIDVDYDTTANGAWSTSNVTLRFRLQASIAAVGSDSNYVVAFGNSLANVLRNWSNIYPFSDSFAGTTLDSTKWTSTAAAGGAVSVNNGLTISTGTGGGNSYIIAKSPYTYGVNYMLEASANPIMPAVSSVGSGVQFGDSILAGRAPGAAPGRALAVRINSGLQWGLGEDPPSLTWAIQFFGTATTGSHWWRIASDAAGSTYGNVDAASASNTASAQQFTTAIPPGVISFGASQQITTSWVKVRPWNGPGNDPTVSSGTSVFRSGTVIATSTSASPLVRSGGRGIARNSASNWLTLYSDGTNAVSKSGGSGPALASASPSTLSSAASAVLGATIIAGGTDGTALAVLADTGTGNPPDVKTYNSTTGLWSAGNATGLPSGATFAGTLYNSGATTYWHLLTASPSSTSIKHWVSTTQGGPFTALTTATTAILPSSDPCLMVALYAGNVLGATIDSTGHIAYATLDARTAISGGSSISASTLTLTGSALATGENLALLNSLDDGTGDLYLAYNNGTGICVRISKAGGPLSWTAEAQISSTASDGSPALVRDGSGAVTLFWISGAAGHPILSQRLQVVSNTVTLIGTTLTRTTYVANRSNLSCVPSEPSGTVGLVWLES